jgi:Yip1 domain
VSDISIPDHLAGQAAEPGSLPKRIIDTYFSPIALFRRFADRAPWVDVLLISAVLTGLLTLLVPHDLLVAQIEESMRQRPQPAGAPAPDPETMAAFGRVFGVVGQLVMQPLMALLAAGIATLIFGMLMDGGGRYRQHLAVASHAALVMPLSVAVTLFFMIQAGDAGTRLSLAVLAPGLAEESFVFRVLSIIDVFTLWWLALIGVGAAAVNRRVSSAAALSVVYALYLAIVAGFAAIF